MSHNLKALGLAMVAAFALSVVVVSQAVALNTHHIKVPTAPANLTGKEDGQFAFRFTDDEGKLECESYFEATVSANKNTSLTAKPTFRNCTLSGYIAEIDTNHCAFVFELDTDLAGKAGIELECASGNEITITFTKGEVTCIIHVPPKTYRGVHYTETVHPETGKKDITFNVVLSGVEYTETENAESCPPEHAGKDGKLEAYFTVEGFKHKGGTECAELTGTAKTTPPLDYFEKCEGEVQNLELEANAT
jgi:hypothetical protein